MIAPKLSSLQKQILGNMLACIRSHERGGDDYGEIVQLRRVPWSLLRPQGQPKDRADSAAFSRAVRRLELRGLVLRLNRTRGDLSTGRIRSSTLEPAPRRSDCLLLTEAGEEVARAMHLDEPRK
jgi:hypothetical protein